MRIDGQEGINGSKIKKIIYKIYFKINSLGQIR